MIRGVKMLLFLIDAGWTNLTSDNCSPIPTFCKHSVAKILKVGTVDWGHLNGNCEKGVRYNYQIHCYNNILLRFNYTPKDNIDIQDHLIQNVESQLHAKHMSCNYNFLSILNHTKMK